MPLKDWDISINYGIKTGYNDAFIVDEAKREEILKNCGSEEERKRTAELIRPILRGRDIKRYSYQWAHLYIIATFPAKHIDIEQYPAVKAHLLSFGMHRLEQTGKTHEVNGKPVKARKKTGNKWFETQDQIGYWNDFSKPKIVWAELARTGNAFTFDNNLNCLGNTGYILVMEDGAKKGIGYEWLLAVLNSKAILFYLDIISTRFDETGWRWLRQYVDLLPVPVVPRSQQDGIATTVQEELQHSSAEGQNRLNDAVNKIYGFTSEEVDFLNNHFLPSTS